MLVQRKASVRSGGERGDIHEQCIPGLRDLGRPFVAEQIAQRVSDDGEEGGEQLALRAVSIVLGELAGDQPEMPTALAGEIENGLDR